MLKIYFSLHASYRNRRRLLTDSVSPLVITKVARPAALLAGGSAFILGLLAQLSTVALATDYTTTQFQSLQIGDTITTTGDGKAGYGLSSTVGTELVLPGNNIIKTSGSDATGLFAVSATPNSNIKATGATITTTGAGAKGAHIGNGSIITLNGVTINAQGASSAGVIIETGGILIADDLTVINSSGYGVSGNGVITLNGTHITSADGHGVWFAVGSSASVTGNAVIKTSGDDGYGIFSSTDGAGFAPLVDSGVSVETRGKGAWGVVTGNATTRRLQVNAATIVTHGDNADGARAAYKATNTLNKTHITTHGANAAGAAVGNAPAGAGDTNDTITMTGVTVTTTGDGSNAVQIYDATNNITMDVATKLSTSGDGAHGISLQGGATKTYNTATKLAVSISIMGKDSAAFHSTGAATNLVMSVSNGITLGPDSWTALAEDGGSIQLTNFTFGVDGVWARGADANNIGTAVLSGTTAKGTRMRADANGLIDIRGITDKAGFSVGALSGDSGTIQLGLTSLTVDGDAVTTFGGNFIGTGSLIRSGTNGSLTLTGDNSAYTADVLVGGGGLYIDGKIGGKATVTGGVLGGSGTVGGDVAVSGGGSLAGRQGQVLSIAGNLAIAGDGIMTVALGAPEVAGTPGLFNVTGDVALDGKLNITDQGGFAPGLYRLVDYTGNLTSNTMTIGDVPVETNATQMSIQTSVANQVNLLNMSGADLNFWDGTSMANHGNGAIDGGTGTWNKANTNWTDKDGLSHAAWDDGQFAIFTGTAGTVTVDNAGGDIVIDGMQFAVDGYRIEGDTITLLDGEAIMRIGVGNGTGKGMSATIASEMKGNASLNKMDHGTLILTGDNSYSGGTTISEGTLQLGDGGATGSVQGDILNNATLAVNRSGDYTLSGKISGSGALVQNGTGTLILTADNAYTGGTTINAGTLQLGDGGTSGSIKGNVINAGVLAVNRSDKIVLDSAIGGKGALQQNGAGTTVLTGDSAYSGGTIINAGTLQIGNGETTGSIAGDVTNNGTLSFNRSDQLIFSKVISGTGSVTQDGTGTTLMTGANTYTGATRINAGTLQQKMHGSFSAASAYYVAANATLDIGGYKTTLASLDNGGMVSFGTNPGAVVNLAGNYTGNGGVLVMNAVLGDDSSKTDLLKVGGDMSGKSTVKVINRGGVGGRTNEGIKIIDVGGQSNGTFNLAGDYTTKSGESAVVAGAYAYTLHEGGVSTPDDGDWYLRSEQKGGSGPVINPGVPLYQGAVQTLQALNTLPTLQQRVGNRYWNGAANPVIEQGADMAGTPLVPAAEAGAVVDGRAVWGRIEGAHNRFEANRSTSGMKQYINSFILQAGVDGQFYEGETGRLIGGITGQYGKARGDVASDHGDGKIDTQGWGLGGTLTWYGDTGFYADLQAQAMWYDSDLTSATAGRSLINGNKGFGYGFSAEAGRRIDLDNYWSLTPQAQLTWSSVTFDTFNDAWGASVSGRNDDSLNARLGLSADYRNAWRDMHGQIRRSNVYVIANLYQELTGGSSGRVRVAGVDFETEADRTWGGLGAGGTLTWADDKYALYGEGSVNTSLSNFADSYALKGTVGFKVKW